MDTESLEKSSPAGLTGPVREKALDAAAFATWLLHMSIQGIVVLVQEIATEHGIEPALRRDAGSR